MFKSPRRYLGRAILGGALFGLIALPSQSLAFTQLDFGIIAPTSGTLSYGGGTDPLVGTNIQVDNITGLNTKFNDGVTVTCVDCVLNFTTGANTGGWHWKGGATTTITIVGGVDFDGGGIGAGDIPLGTTLLSGAFGSATILPVSNIFKLLGASFTDTKDADLLAFFGIPSDAHLQGALNLSFNTDATVGNAFTSTSLLSGDLVNTVPEPASMFILGLGLGALGLISRVKVKS